MRMKSKAGVRKKSQREASLAEEKTKTARQRVHHVVVLHRTEPARGPRRDSTVLESPFMDQELDAGYYTEPVEPERVTPAAKPAGSSNAVRFAPAGGVGN